MLITGAAGKIGTHCAALLRKQGYKLRLLDTDTPSAATEEDEVVEASMLDESAVRKAMEGVKVLLHLGALSVEHSYEQIMEVNVASLRVVLEAARDAKVETTILASSVHAVGFYPFDSAGAKEKVPLPRPDTWYGLSKVIMEGMGSLFSDRFEMKIISTRIHTFEPAPTHLRSLSTWLSPVDYVRLIVAADQNAPNAAHTIVWAISANQRNKALNFQAGYDIGYRPQDDAEVHAEDVARRLGYTSASELPSMGSQPIGGWHFTKNTLGTMDYEE